MEQTTNQNVPVIGLFTSVVFNNIGNAFIDFGAEATIKAAIPSAEIIKVSSFANFAATMGKTFLLKENKFINWFWTRIMQKYAKKLHDKSYKSVNTLNVFSPAKIALFDYLIIPGCVLTTPYFVIYGNFLKEKVRQGCKLIFWGASGNHYTEEEIKFVSEWLRKLKPYAICTRDSKAYNYYSSYSNNVFNGIDNVFFVNLLNLPKIKTTMDPYIALNFDEPKHNYIKKALISKHSAKHIVETNHKPFPFSKISALIKKNIMVSEYPLDYLFIYNNVEETHTDRVHACIPTLSFGNKAQLYSDSPRIALFENVGLNLSEMKSKPVSLSREKLYELQQKQINFLKSIIK